MQGVGEFPLYPRKGWHSGAPFSAVRLGDRAAQVAGKGPRKENEKEEMKKISGSSILCHEGVGWGCPGPAQEASSPSGGGQHKEAGIWQMASVWGYGGWGRLAIRWQARRSYLIFWAHFMSSARGFSPVRPWMRSSRRRQKPIFSRG